MLFLSFMGVSNDFELKSIILSFGLLKSFLISSKFVRFFIICPFESKVNLSGSKSFVI
jgi:hypothetical protein